MELTIEQLQEILEMARQKNWRFGIQRVEARHRIAINSLIAQDGNLFGKDADSILRLLNQENNKGIRGIFLETDKNAIAFAIRDALN